MADTELRLAFWRDGSTKAERLAAAALKLAGYDEINPQHPLGGADDGQDILCVKGGRRWVGAVYFPTGPKSFSAIKKKFIGDFAGVGDNDGIVFVTNQTISRGQRAALGKLGTDAGKEVDIVHLERLRAMLDQGTGFGIRLLYLGIPVSVEEQMSWFAESGDQLASALDSNTRELRLLKALVERLTDGQEHIVRTLDLNLSARPLGPDLLSATPFTRSDAYGPATATLDPTMVLLFHRLLCFELPERIVGKLRTVEAYLGTADGKLAQHVQPPAARLVPDSLEKVCESWRAKFAILQDSPPLPKLVAMAEFHSALLVVHPFVDGNGRVARALLMQQCLDLFGKADMSVMDKGARYYAALAAADQGNPRPLAELISTVAGTTL